MAFSRALRVATALDATEPQCAQWGDIYAGSARGAGGFGLAVPAQVRAAGFAGGFDLFVSSYVGLGEFHVLPGACYLTFVTLCESLIHNSSLHCGKLDPYEALLDIDFCRHFGLRTSRGDSHVYFAGREGTCAEEYRSDDRRRTDHADGEGERQGGNRFDGHDDDAGLDRYARACHVVFQSGRKAGAGRARGEIHAAAGGALRGREPLRDADGRVHYGAERGGGTGRRSARTDRGGARRGDRG